MALRRHTGDSKMSDYNELLYLCNCAVAQWLLWTRSRQNIPSYFAQRRAIANCSLLRLTLLLRVIKLSSLPSLVWVLLLRQFQWCHCVTEPTVLPIWLLSYLWAVLSRKMVDIVELQKIWPGLLWECASSSKCHQPTINLTSSSSRTCMSIVCERLIGQSRTHYLIEPSHCTTLNPPVSKFCMLIAMWMGLSVKLPVPPFVVCYNLLTDCAHPWPNFEHKTTEHCCKNLIDTRLLALSGTI